MRVLSLIALGIFLLIGGSCDRVAASPPTPAPAVAAPATSSASQDAPFGFVTEAKLAVGGDGNKGYLLTEDGRLFFLYGPRATEILPATRQVAVTASVLTDADMKGSTPAPRDLLAEAGIAPATRPATNRDPNDLLEGRR